MSSTEIDIGRDFSPYPAGRFTKNGEFSGEKFREEFLAPAVREYDRVVISLDNTRGYSSSFLEEAFGGLRRKSEFSDKDLTSVISLNTRDRSLILEITDYLTSDHQFSTYV